MLSVFHLVCSCSFCQARGRTLGRGQIGGLQSPTWWDEVLTSVSTGETRSHSEMLIGWRKEETEPCSRDQREVRIRFDGWFLSTGWQLHLFLRGQNKLIIVSVLCYSGELFDLVHGQQLIFFRFASCCQCEVIPRCWPHLRCFAFVYITNIHSIDPNWQ